MTEENDFRTVLTILLNRYSKENGSNTLDLFLAAYTICALQLADKLINRRGEWNELRKVAEQVEKDVEDYWGE